METKGLKLLENGKTRWVSFIKPLRRIIQLYMVLLAKMKVDNDSNERSAHVICLPPSCFFSAIWVMFLCSFFISIFVLFANLLCWYVVLVCCVIC
jgi:hypothetical protein